MKTPLAKDAKKISNGLVEGPEDVAGRSNLREANGAVKGYGRGV